MDALGATSCVPFTRPGGRMKSALLPSTTIGDLEVSAHLTRYDSAHGPFNLSVQADGDAMMVGDDRIRFTACRNPGGHSLERVGSGCGDRVDRPFCIAREVARPSGGRRPPGADLGSGRQGRGCDRGVWRQSRPAGPGSRRGLQCFLHDELPGAAGQGPDGIGRDRFPAS